MVGCEEGVVIANGVLWVGFGAFALCRRVPVISLYVITKYMY